MRCWLVVLAFVGCARVQPPAPIARGNCSDVPLEPSLGLTHFKQVGNCRYEVRRGSACCLVGFDFEESGASVIPGKQFDLDDDLLIASGAAPVKAFQPSERWLHAGEHFDVCGETVVCAP